MKKNILGAFVIIFITVALFLMIDDITRSSKPQANQNVQILDHRGQPEMATLDSE
jgi:uncharacterized membrane protein